jgi:hypothetical protein
MARDKPGHEVGAQLHCNLLEVVMNPPAERPATADAAFISHFISAQDGRQTLD